MKKKKVVILGAGFGGVEAAREVYKKTRGSVEIVLVSKKPYFEYYPGLYRVLSSEPPFEVFVPLKFLVPNKVRLFIDEVIAIELKEKKIVLKEGLIDDYDILIIALGSEAFYFNIPGIEKYSLGCKSLVDVRYLRRELISKINKMHDENKELHVVVAGGGPTGVEMAGQLHSLFKDESRFQDIDCARLKVILVQADSRLIPQLDSNEISEKVKAQMKLLGIEVYTETKILEQNESSVILSNGILDTDTLIWTAGTQMNKVLQHTEGFVLSPKRKILVNDFLQAEGLEHVYVIGDNADTKYSGLAQTAVSHGAYVGKTVAQVLRNKKIYRYKPNHSPAYVMPVGRFWGIFHFKGITITGIIPHMMRYSVDIFYFFRRLHFFNFLRLYIKGRLPEN